MVKRRRSGMGVVGRRPWMHKPIGSRHASLRRPISRFWNFAPSSPSVASPPARARYRGFSAGSGSASKKSLLASEQERPDVVAARDAWRADQRHLDPRKLVFI